MEQSHPDDPTRMERKRTILSMLHACARPNDIITIFLFYLLLEQVHRTCNSEFPHWERVNQCHCPSIPTKTISLDKDNVNILLFSSHDDITTGINPVIASWIHGHVSYCHQWCLSPAASLQYQYEEHQQQHQDLGWVELEPWDLQDRQ